MVRLSTPVSRHDILTLKVGDQVLINGLIYTLRDRMHSYLMQVRPETEELPFDLEGSIVYHCGPLLRKTDDGFQVLSAGPTTSSRFDLYIPEFIKHYKPCAIMGKGGVGDDTVRSMVELGCVYLNTINGSAVYLADRIKRVVDVYKREDFGDVEAMWVLEVSDFPAIVTIDSQGRNLHNTIEGLSLQNVKSLFL